MDLQRGDVVDSWESQTRSHLRRIDGLPTGKLNTLGYCDIDLLTTYCTYR
jgi:hypothetical protein